GRGGQGVINIRMTSRNGRVIAVAQCREGDDALFVTGEGMIVRTQIANISTMSRATQGVKLVNLKDGDSLVGLGVVFESDLERYQSEIEEAVEEAVAAGTPPVAQMDGEPEDAGALEEDDVEDESGEDEPDEDEAEDLDEES